MYRIGITGGMASGKSIIADMFQQFGSSYTKPDSHGRAALVALVLKADSLGHEVLTAPNHAHYKVVAEFGTDILNSDHFISRKALAAIVFNSEPKLRLLDSIVHPAIRDLCASRVKAVNPVIFIYEVAMLFESEMADQFDYIIAVDCPRDVQIDRAMRRDGATREMVEARIDKQIRVERYQHRVDCIINGNVPLESLSLSAQRQWTYLTTEVLPKHTA